MHGINLLDSLKRDKIIYHINFDEILYVMGKGNKLKIGFIYRQPIMEQVLTNDCRTEFTT